MTVAQDATRPAVIDQTAAIEEILTRRIMVLDGAWGTTIQGYQLEEEDFRGERFKDHPVDVKGNADMLVLTQPQIVEEIQRSYLEAGADIVETNTFTASTISQSDYQLEQYTYEINLEAARIARRVADEYTPAIPATATLRSTSSRIPTA